MEKPAYCLPTMINALNGELQSVTTPCLKMSQYRLMAERWNGIVKWIL